MKVLNEQILVNRVPTLDGSFFMRNCEKHLKDVPERKPDVIIHVVSKESIQLSTVRSEVPKIDCFIWTKNALYWDRSSSHSPAQCQHPFIRICKIFSNFAVTSLAELIILGGFNEERYLTSKYFDGHLNYAQLCNILVTRYMSFYK